jgi:crotonobetainyl-CoA:carnitine CoA-transferase CaiB-like acyl-CoA transferase
MVEAALNIAAEQLIVCSAYGKVPMRTGNRGPDAAPQGVYACRGEEQWLALAVATDEHWRALVDVLDSPRWAQAAELSHFAGRRAAHDLLDGRLAAWAREQDLDAAVARLIAAGVPAARVVDPRTTSQHPRHLERGWYEWVDHPVAGRQPIPGPPFRFASVDAWHRSPAPLLGQHNHEVLGTLLGLSDDELLELEASHVAGRVLVSA